MVDKSQIRELRIQLIARPASDDCDALGILMQLKDVVENSIEVQIDREKMRAANLCPLCKCPIFDWDFLGKGQEYRDEFDISGLCPICQDDIFAAVEDDE